MLLKNSIYCNHCKTEIISKHVHDFVSCKCKGEKRITTDGGSYYQHYGYGEEASFTITSVYDDAKLETRLKYLTWGTYGKSEDEFKVKLVKDLSDNHICAILNTQKRIPKVYIETMEDLIIWREENNEMILE